MTDSPPPKGRQPGRPRHVTPSADYLKRHEEIVEAAAKVFQEKGYGSGSLDDVAAALDLRKASLYYYVHSKAELLYLIFERAIDGAIEDLEQLAISGSPAERLAGLLRHQVRTVASNPSLFAVFFDQRPHLEDDQEARIRDKERRYLGLFVDAVDAAIGSGSIAVENSHYAAQLLLGMANWSYKWVDPDHDDVETIADAAVRLVLGSSKTGGDVR
ncbi:MAG: TetR/AcrR family transcriptional regulator [Acidimicrobiales bacterium]